MQEPCGLLAEWQKGRGTMWLQQRAPWPHPHQPVMTGPAPTEHCPCSSASSHGLLRAVREKLSCCQGEASGAVVTSFFTPLPPPACHALCWHQLLGASQKGHRTRRGLCSAQSRELAASALPGPSCSQLQCRCAHQAKQPLEAAKQQPLLPPPSQPHALTSLSQSSQQESALKNLQRKNYLLSLLAFCHCDSLQESCSDRGALLLVLHNDQQTAKLPPLLFLHKRHL